MLIKSVNSNVSKKGWFAVFGIGSVVETFANVAPVVYCSVIDLDIAIVVTETCGLR
jgi:hypothetical protein